MPTITLPTLHAGQVRAYEAIQGTKRAALRCGRRFGKTVLLETIGANDAAWGWPVGIFAPDYKILSETYHDLVDILEPILTQKSQMKGVIRTSTGGRIDFWTLDNPRAGRSRKYKTVLMDEVAFTKGNMIEIWERSIEPTLLDLVGRALLFSNTNGTDPANFMWKACNDKALGFLDYHAPTSDNPHLPASEIERLRTTVHPLVWRQEYLAEFVDFSGEAFFPATWMLVDGQGVPLPDRCDAVVAVIDTAMKDGKEHDGTAVSFYAVQQYHGIPLVLLDWDIVAIQGAMLETWLPGVFAKLDAYARRCGARSGSAGAHIEDRGSGTILLQQAANRGWRAFALPEKLTALGKSGRALNVSGHVFQGKLKLSQQAFDKMTDYKGVYRNHWLAQVTGFRVGVDEGLADDLLDTMTYGLAITLGDSEGYAT